MTSRSFFDCAAATEGIANDSSAVAANGTAKQRVKNRDTFPS
jgi:hypothetical protein